MFQPHNVITTVSTFTSALSFLSVFHGDRETKLISEQRCFIFDIYASKHQVYMNYGIFVGFLTGTGRRGPVCNVWAITSTIQYAQKVSLHLKKRRSF